MILIYRTILKRYLLTTEPFKFYMQTQRTEEESGAAHVIMVSNTMQTDFVSIFRSTITLWANTCCQRREVQTLRSGWAIPSDQSKLLCFCNGGITRITSFTQGLR